MCFLLFTICYRVIWNKTVPSPETRATIHFTDPVSWYHKLHSETLFFLQQHHCTPHCCRHGPATAPLHPHTVWSYNSTTAPHTVAGTVLQAQSLATGSTKLCSQQYCLTHRYVHECLAREKGLRCTLPRSLCWECWTHRLTKSCRLTRCIKWLKTLISWKFYSILPSFVLILEISFFWWLSRYS